MDIKYDSYDDAIMDIKYDSYDDAIYDKSNFTIKKCIHLCVGDICCYDNTCYRITGISKSRKKPIRLIYFIGVFTDEITNTVFYEDNDILVPIIHKYNCEFVNMTDKYISLFNYEKNDMVDIPFTSINKNIIGIIREKQKITDEINVAVIEFQTWKTITNVK